MSSFPNGMFGDCEGPIWDPDAPSSFSTWDNDPEIGSGYSSSYVQRIEDENRRLRARLAEQQRQRS